MSTTPFTTPAAQALARSARASAQASVSRTLRRGALKVLSGWRRDERALDRRCRVLGQVARRRGLDAESHAFLVAGLGQLERISGVLRERAVSAELRIDWQQSVVSELEKEAARARHAERRGGVRQGLPDEQVRSRRQRLLDDMTALETELAEGD